MRIRINLLFILISFCFCACGQSQSEAKQVQRDTSVTTKTSVSDLFVDSSVLERFIREQDVREERAVQLRNFYKSRNYEYAWFNKNGFSQQAQSFWSLHNNYVRYSKDSSLFDKQLHDQMKEFLGDEEDSVISETDMQLLEVKWTDHFFDYAHYAYAGKIDPEAVNWHIPKKKINPIRLLDSLVQRNGRKLDDWEPVSLQYKLLRDQLLRLYDVRKQGGWPVIDKSVYRKGDSSLGVQQIKARLKMGGDFTSGDQSPVFTNELEDALINAQKRFGLKQDGIAGPQTMSQLNIPVEDRIEQLLVNMERMRWMPAQGQGTRLVANIPEFKLHVYENKKEILQMKIVVGKSANKTVVFNDRLQYVVFSPYWNVPRSIVRNEILPGMKKDPSYLQRHNMEQTGSSNGLPIIRQKPGANNALGRVKFIFPNSYNIYFHDTPAKSLFEHQNRAFSHGCIRLEKPEELANYLLKDKEGWTKKKIRKTMYAGKETWVKLDEQVQVLIAYFTAWVSEDGLLNFREDIYGRDRELKEMLFQD